MGAWTEPKTGSSYKENPKSGAGKASQQPHVLQSHRSQPGQGHQAGPSSTSWNLPFLSPHLAFPSPLLSPHRSLSKPRGAGGLFQGAGRVPHAQGCCWDPGQVSREGAAAAGVGGLGSTLCSRPQEKNEPSFIYFSCRLCFRCCPEGPFEAAQAAPDPSSLLINMCRQPGLPGAAEQGQP